MVTFDIKGRSGEWACDRWIEVTHRDGFFEGWVMEFPCDDYIPDAIGHFTAQTARDALAEVRDWQQAF